MFPLFRSYSFRQRKHQRADWTEGGKFDHFNKTDRETGGWRTRDQIDDGSRRLCPMCLKPGHWLKIRWRPKWIPCVIASKMRSRFRQLVDLWRCQLWFDRLAWSINSLRLKKIEEHCSYFFYKLKSNSRIIFFLYDLWPLNNVNEIIEVIISDYWTTTASDRVLKMHWKLYSARLK